MKITDFLSDIELKCSEIAYLSIVHILEKIYDIENDELNYDEVIDFFQDFAKVQRYLNDYAGVIYRRHNSSVEEIYSELCAYLNIDADNEYMFEFAISKLENNTPAKIMQIEDDEMKHFTIEKLESKLEKVLELQYYKDNIEELKPRVDKIIKNFALVKKALKLNSDY